MNKIILLLLLTNLFVTVVYAQQMNFTTSSGQGGYIKYNPDHVRLYDCNNSAEMHSGTSSFAETKITNLLKETVKVFEILPFDPEGKAGNFNETKKFYKAIDPGYTLSAKMSLLRAYILEDTKGKCLAVVKRSSFEFREVMLQPSGASQYNKSEGSDAVNASNNKLANDNVPPQNGYGTFTNARGDFYSGNWANGKLNGKGSYKAAGGETYTGEWKDDQMHGWGKYTWQNDSSWYEGNWVNGVREGFGKLFYANGNVYSGDWRQNLREGEGMLTYHNGDSYTGQWKESKRHGHGTYAFANGAKYSGFWANDRMNGKVMLYQVNGGIVEYEFVNGEKRSEKVIKEDDKTFEGIGISFDYNAEKKVYIITRVGDRTPAQAAGLQVNDVLVSANGIVFSGKSTLEVMNVIKGPAGSKVKVGILRNGVPMELAAQRGKIDVAQMQQVE